MTEKIKAFGFDQSAARDVGEMFLLEAAKTLTNGSSPGHHSAVLIVKDEDDTNTTDIGNSDPDRNEKQRSADEVHKLGRHTNPSHLDRKERRWGAAYAGQGKF